MKPSKIIDTFETYQSLVTNLRLATPIGTCKVASSVDYSL